MRFLQQFRYGYFLRALFQTLFAFNAFIPSLFFFDFLVRYTTFAAFRSHYKSSPHCRNQRREVCPHHWDRACNTCKQCMIPDLVNDRHPDSPNQCQFISRQIVWLGMLSGSDIFYHLLHCAHPAQSQCHFRMIPDPA